MCPSSIIPITGDRTARQAQSLEDSTAASEADRANAFDLSLKLSQAEVHSAPVVSLLHCTTKSSLNTEALREADDMWVNVLALSEQLQDKRLPEDQRASLVKEISQNLESFHAYIRALEGQISSEQS